MEMDEDQELKSEMINEITSSLDDLDNFLISLEQNPEDTGCLNEIFRLLHSIKGLSSFFNYHGIEKVSHNAEHLLDLLRNNDLSISTEMISTLLSTIDVLREFMTNIETIDSEGDVTYEPLIETLLSFVNGETDSVNKEVSEESSKESMVDNVTQEVSKEIVEVPIKNNASPQKKEV